MLDVAMQLGGDALLLLLETGASEYALSVQCTLRVERCALRVESIVAILERATGLVRELEEGPGAAVLSTHGDVASVLYCASLGLPLSRHREVGALANGELRLLGKL